MHDSQLPVGPSGWQRRIKRTVDVVGATVLLILTSWLIAIGWILSMASTRKNGFFTQDRVGLDGRTFRIVKLRTMREDGEFATSVTAATDPRITRIGHWLRLTKVDELPQLFNVLKGDMSLVGPRPEVPGWTDQLHGNDRIVLTMRPGITGPATIAFRNEEVLLARQRDPEAFGREVLFPEKVRINVSYVRNYRFRNDVALLFKTASSLLRRADTAAPRTRKPDE